jgi:hypothetical protein
MGRNAYTDVLFYAFVVGGIFVLTKPGSTGATFVSNVAKGSIGLVQASTGQTVSQS